MDDADVSKKWMVKLLMWTVRYCTSRREMRRRRRLRKGERKKEESMVFMLAGRSFLAEGWGLGASECVPCRWRAAVTPPSRRRTE